MYNVHIYIYRGKPKGVDGPPKVSTIPKILHTTPPPHDVVHWPGRSLFILRIQIWSRCLSLSRPIERRLGRAKWGQIFCNDATLPRPPRCNVSSRRMFGAQAIATLWVNFNLITSSILKHWAKPNVWILRNVLLIVADDAGRQLGHLGDPLVWLHLIRDYLGLRGYWVLLPS